MIKISNSVVNDVKNEIVKSITYESNSKLVFNLFDGRVFTKEKAHFNDANFALNDPDAAYKKWFEGK